MEVTAEGEKESLEGLSASGGKFIRGGKHGGGRWSENVSSSTQARSESRGHSPGGRFRDNSMELKKEIETALETLEAFYFFTQGVKDESAAHLEKVRAIYRYLLSEGYPKLLADIQRDVTGIRDHYGALAPDEFYRKLLREARAAEGKGLVYISKLRIVRDIFSRYDNSIVRWSHIKLHSFVVFEPKVGFPNMMFEIDGQLFHDAQFMLYKVRQAQGEAKTQRDLAPTRHRVLHTLLRSVVTALFTFMEAYLNGIAFDCFHAHHDGLDLDDHDFLGEWNSTKKQRKFVRFDEKVFGYPKVIAKVKGGRCGIHQRAFLLLVRREAKETWTVMFAVPAPPDTGDVTRASSPGVELVGRLEVRGSVVLAHDYVGCPFCGGEGIFECGCGVLNCAGGRRMHVDHKDYLCAGCGRWRCMGKAGKMDSLSGFAETRTRVSVEYPNELPQNGASPSLKRVDRPALPSGTGLVRRG